MSEGLAEYGGIRSATWAVKEKGDIGKCSGEKDEREVSDHKREDAERTRTDG